MWKKLYPFLTPLSFGAMLLAASCSTGRGGEELPGSGETCAVEFRLAGEETRATGVSDADESRVDHWALFVFDPSTGLAVASGTSSSAAPIRQTLPVGTYSTCALVNYPVSGAGALDPDAVRSESALKGTIAFLADNVPGSLEMSGQKTVALSAGTSAEQIPVERLVSKVSVKKVTVRLSNPALAAQSFVLDGMWLDNVYSQTSWGADYEAGQLSATRSLWYNTMDWHAVGSCLSPACPDALLGERNIAAVIPQNGSHNVRHTFYVIPNATPAVMDSRSAVWSKRCTRLVLQATVGTKTCYYVVTLPALQRNHSYTIEEAVITRLGSEDPEQEIPGALDLFFSTSDPDWEGPRTVSEQS